MDGFREMNAQKRILQIRHRINVHFHVGFIFGVFQIQAFERDHRVIPAKTETLRDLVSIKPGAVNDFIGGKIALGGMNGIAGT